MDIRLLVLIGKIGPVSFLATGSLVVFMATTVMRVDAQQLVPFGDVPATENFLRQRSLLGDDSQIAR
jgi:hypothetical protein